MAEFTLRIRRTGAERVVTIGDPAGVRSACAGRVLSIGDPAGVRGAAVGLCSGWDRQSPEKTALKAGQTLKQQRSVILRASLLLLIASVRLFHHAYQAFLDHAEVASRFCRPHRRWRPCIWRPGSPV